MKKEKLDFSVLNDIATFWSTEVPGLVKEPLSAESIPGKQNCDRCGTSMNIHSFQLHTNKKQYTRAWQCPQCHDFLHEYSLVGV